MDFFHLFFSTHEFLKCVYFSGYISGVAFKTRYHAFILRTIFVIKTPETLYDILRLSIPIIATGLMEDVACQSEPTIPDLSTALEEMLAK